MSEYFFVATTQTVGPHVAALQRALSLLLERGALLDEGDRILQELRQAFEREVAAQVIGDATHKLLAIFQESRRLKVSGLLDELTAAALNHLLSELAAVQHEERAFVVSGTVRYADGFPAAGVDVVALDLDFRSEEELGRATTGKDGKYEIRYSPRQFRKLEKGNADLRVRALGADGEELAASTIVFNAKPETTVDLTIEPHAAEPPSLYEKIERTLAPVLENFSAAELEEDAEHQDLSFLAGETGFTKGQLARYALSQRLVRPSLPAEFWFALLGSIFTYAADHPLRDQAKSVTDLLPSIDSKAVGRALESAFTRKELPEALRKQTPSWSEAFARLAAAEAVSGDGSPVIKQIVEQVGLPREKGETFARLFAELKSVPAVLDEIEKAPAFDKREVAELRTTFRLADITGGDFAMAKAIKDEFGVREPAQIAALARRTEDDWSRLVLDAHAAGRIELPFELPEIPRNKEPVSTTRAYATLLAKQFRDAFPTAAFAGGLERAMQNGGTKGLRQPEKLMRFLDTHHDFELMNTPIDAFLDEKTKPAAEALAKDESFRTELKAVQRVYKLAPTYEATDALLADGVHSAQQIYRMGESGFVQRYEKRDGFTTATARQTWNRAADTHAAVVSLIGNLKAMESESLPQALVLDADALSTFPNWNNLFQAGDVCECEQCRSVLSPAAYFTDLLLFLKDRAPKSAAASVKDVLLARRPDLGYLELNCENALTAFPYIDTVNEVLEAALTGEADDVQLNGFAAMPAANREAAVAAAFAAVAPDPIVTGDFTLSQIDPTDSDLWIAHGSEATYLLKKKPPAANFFAQVLRNTKASAAELRAYPRYVSAPVYDTTLKAQKYPLALPFDLFAEEVRASLSKVNVPRWELMETLRAAANNPSDSDIAAEYFAISSDPAAPTDEWRLITDQAAATVAEQQAVWGENAADWIDRAGNVKRFLDKTGLEYNDILALLDLAFINPAGDIAIHHDDPSCDTETKWIRTLDPPKLDRIHRFLRLWRKLPKWKFWELDLVLRSIGGDTLNDDFIKALFPFSRLRKRLGDKVSVEQLAALFTDLETNSHFTKLYEKRDDALYQRLFLNKRLVNPVDRAFEIDPATGDLAGGETISAHQAVVQAALGLQEADLKTLRELTKASDGTPYINDDLNLANLSFLWRHAFLSKLLKLKADEWQIVLDLNGADIAAFADPQSAWDFVETLDRVKTAGLKADALSWILAADRDAKSATKEQDATRFLSALRKELQAIASELDPAQYDFLTAAVPTDEAQLSALLTSLLGKLNRDEAATAYFTKVLEGRVVLETNVEGLPAGFAFPAAITGAGNQIPIEYVEPAKLLRVTGLLSDAQRTVLRSALVPAAVTGLQSYQEALDALVTQSAAAGDRFAVSSVTVNLPGGVVLPPAMPSLPIAYDAPANRLSFTGVMTVAERAALAIGNPAAAIDELFDTPRRAVKFFDAAFETPLDPLPPAIDFKAQLAPDLAAKISFDAERRMLRFAGFMTPAEQAALHLLVPNVPANAAFHAAVNQLAALPQAITAPDERVWLEDADLDAAVAANDTTAKRLANAAKKALAHLSRTLAANRAVLDGSAALGLTDAMTRRLLDGFAILPPIAPDPANVTLLAHLTRVFAPSGGAVDYTAQKTTFDGWFWANRAAALLKQWKLTLPEWERLLTLTGPAGLLDLSTLPMDSAAPRASLEGYLDTARVLRQRDRFPEKTLTFLELLVNVQAGAYVNAALFAADVERVAETWSAAGVEAFVAAIDAIFPVDYLNVDVWERMRRAFVFVDALNAGPATLKRFAAATMHKADARTVAELLRSKLGTETWLTLAAEIQDILRERKRDALVAFLLTKPKPADAPSGKWENTNDLYAYYLLDVEMSSCALTSRLVQGSGSIQLFVQRCFMGLEPDVEVKADGDDGDSAWRWWKWMRKYRVWEANRKVFLWPENWIEPELKKDRSSFFKDLENDLMQNEVNQPNAETAFTSYLEKLDGVAQLEIAGFFQEDDADQTILHVFGRTRGAEPHLYYYRRFDFTQWSPWEKVELDIQGDYLVPAVVAGRLFLFWPIFTEVPDEAGNESMKIPKAPGKDEGSFTPDKTKKNLRMQMAVSDYRQGKWTPKRVSKDFAESGTYTAEIERKHYFFLPIDRGNVDGRFGIRFEGYSTGKLLEESDHVAQLSGSFEIAGCKGVPELADLPGSFTLALRPEEAAVGDVTTFGKWTELLNRADNENDFALQELFTVIRDRSAVTILRQTPWLFRVSPPLQLSYIDRLTANGLKLFGQFSRELQLPLGTWLPFFYADKQRTFLALPALRSPAAGDVANRPAGVYVHYPEIKGFARGVEKMMEGVFRQALKDFDLSGLSGQSRHDIDALVFSVFPLQAAAPEDNPPPYTKEESATVREFFIRFLMRFVDFWLSGVLLQLLAFRQWDFKNFYHPFVCDFLRLVYNPLQGIPALMDRGTQLKTTPMRFRSTYQPTEWVVAPGTEDFYPKEVVDFDPDGSQTPYNMETFLFAPLLIGNALSRNQRFEEARDWYHYIFNPLGVSSAQPGGSPMSKYWITKPFFEMTQADYVKQRIDAILRMLAGDTSGPATEARSALEKQVLDWRRNPFEPHRIANYRRIAYQKTVVMKYLDNLIAWGDNLFRQDSMESTNEATQLYILAAEILGPRPRKVPPQVKPPLETFNELEQLKLDKFGNALIQVENVIPPLAGGTSAADGPPLPTLYFCIPQNDKLLGYWDTVADRLYKLRHCMNIEGVVRQLSLFEPPIDPGALVKAVAGGIDISSAIADLNAPLPLYRFTPSLQKANEVCNDVKALGAALLAALEKKDAEALARLRQTQERRVLDAVLSLRETQLDEAKKNVEALENQKKVTETRRNYYRDLERLSSQERLHIDKLRESHTLQEAAQGVKLVASVISIIPAIDIGASGFGGTPIAKFKLGGLELGQAAGLAADVLGFLGQIAANDSITASATATYDRRAADWDYQTRLADRELVQIDTQIEAARIRVAAATKEVENQKLQIENSAAVDEFLHSKYTNEELYQWQIGQISGVFFQSYRLAYDLAKRAERCFRFELGLEDSSFVNFGYWDSLHKGLLSGEKLQIDLRRMESAFMEQNRRELELTKHVSLAMLDPLALVKLRETGRCFVRLPEEIFDLDFPGHYFRRIKSVSLTIPCVTGPYTTIACTLRLLKNSIRANTSMPDGYAHAVDDQGLPADDERFVENNIPVKAIATSTAQNDSGVFELLFRDDRYLPFEGAGTISDWSLELFNDLPANNPDPTNPDFGAELRQFDYNTITDAVLQVRYTAREDAGQFKNAAVTHLREYYELDGTTPSSLLLNLRSDFPSQWHRFLHPAAGAVGNVFELEMSHALFPYRDRGKTLKINTVYLLARCSDDGPYGVTLAPPLIAPADAFSLVKSTQFGGLHIAQKPTAIEIDPDVAPLVWNLTMTSPTGNAIVPDPAEVEEMYVVLGYEWN